MQQLRPGLWTWTAAHPGWTEGEGGPEGWDRLVRSYAYDSGPCLVLIDPLAPPSLLEGLVESKDVAVLLTEHCHVRSADECVERFGATVHAMADAVSRLSLPAQAFERGDTLPGGVVAQIECYPFEAIFWIPAVRAMYMRPGGDELRVATVAGGSPPREAYLHFAVGAALVVSVGSLFAAQPMFELAKDAVAVFFAP